MTRESFYEEQLTALLGLVEQAGHQLGNEAAIVAEHGGTIDQLREIIAQSGRLGDAMVEAVQRTRVKIEELE